MSFFGKLMFWKKPEDNLSNIGLDLNKDFSSPEMGMGRGDDLTGGFDAGLNQPSSSFQHQFSQQSLSPQQPSQMPQFQQPTQQFPQPSYLQQAPSFSQPQQAYYQQPQSPQYAISKDIEIVSIKLDALRAVLESINQRIASIERVAYGEQDQPKRKW